MQLSQRLSARSRFRGSWADFDFLFTLKWRMSKPRAGGKSHLDLEVNVYWMSARADISTGRLFWPSSTRPPEMG